MSICREGPTNIFVGRRYYAKGGYLRDTTMVIGCLKDSIAAAPTPDSEEYALQLSGAVNDVDEDATPYAGRTAGHYWIVDPIWDESADDERCIAWGRKAPGRLAVLSLSGNYVNEQAGFGKVVALSAYGAEKYRQLARRNNLVNLFRLKQNMETEP